MSAVYDFAYICIIACYSAWSSAEPGIMQLNLSMWIHLSISGGYAWCDYYTPQGWTGFIGNNGSGKSNPRPHRLWFIAAQKGIISPSFSRHIALKCNRDPAIFWFCCAYDDAAIKLKQAFLEERLALAFLKHFRAASRSDSRVALLFMGITWRSCARWAHLIMWMSNKTCSLRPCRSSKKYPGSLISHDRSCWTALYSMFVCR